MRILAAVLLGLSCLACAAGQQPGRATPGKRYGVEINAAKFPQSIPQETLLSILRAIETGKAHYLLAQLAEPEFVDRRVWEFRRGVTRGSDVGKTLLAFERFVTEVKAHFAGDPTLIKELYRLAKEGDWQVGNDLASVRLKASPDRGAYFRKIEARWFLLNRQSEPAPDKKGD